MSRVSNVIIACGIGEEAAIDFLNHRLFEKEGWDTRSPFVDIGDKHLESIAGWKAMEKTVLLGAFNCLQREEFINAIRQSPWERPENIQVFICEHDCEEPLFTEVQLGMND